MRGVLGSVGLGDRFTWAKALLDPFSMRDVEVKIPDYNAFPSTAFKSNFSVQLTTNADGDAAFALRPRPKGFRVPATIAGGTITWGAEADVDGYASINSNFGSIRCVALGWKLSYIGKDADCSGRAIICMIPEASTTGGTADYPTTFGGYEIQAWHSDVIQGAVLQAVPITSSAKLVDVDAIDYHPVSQTHSDGWSDLLVMFRGFPISTECINVEVLALWEALPYNVSTGINATPAAPADSEAMNKGFQASQAADPAYASPTPYAATGPYSRSNQMVRERLHTSQHPNGFGPH